MVVTVYQTDRICTFEEVKGAHPVRVKVPAGSELLRTKLFGLELYVPTSKDPRVRAAHSAKSVLDETERKGSRFKAIQASASVTVGRHSR